MELARIKPLDAIREDLPILHTIESNKILYLDFAAILQGKMKDYLELFFPGTDSGPVAEKFSDLVFANYYTWNPIDIQAFINFIELNKPESSGHKISPVELIEAVKEYELARAESQENELKRLYKPQINEKIEATQMPVALREKLNKIGKKHETKMQNLSESAFEKSSTIAKKRLLQETLKTKVLAGLISEEDAIIEFNNFLKLSK